MLEGGTHGTLLYSGGDFEAIIFWLWSTIICALPKVEGRLCDCVLGVGMEKICTAMYTRLLLNIGTI